MKSKLSIIAGILSLLVTSCIGYDDNASQSDTGKNVITLGAEINQVAVTRVNDNGFCDGDVMGVYIVDYNGENPGTLLTNGNRADNLRHTYDEANRKWNSAYDVYWKDEHTAIDIYGYYPWGSPEDVNNYSISVKANQNKAAEGEELGGYEASDFLWGKVAKVAPTANTIKLPLHHKLSSAKVELTEGEGFSDGEWVSLAKSIVIKNVKHEASVDLATGTVTAQGEISSTGIIPYSNGNSFRAIVIPQSVPAGTELFGITVGTKPYSFKKGEEFTYTGGKLHKFTIKVDKKSNTGDYTFTLISEAVIAWENDEVSHDAKLKEYIIINVEEAGTLDKCIADANKEITKVRNLKITGNINSRDMAIMRFKMTSLNAVNLKEATIVAGEGGQLTANDEQSYSNNDAYSIPDNAFHNLTNLTNFVFPDKLKKIGTSAFYGCYNISGSLVLPEGLEHIGTAAFWECRSLTGSLSLPSTLKTIGNHKGYTYYWDGTFHNCGFVDELRIPESVTVIGMGAFSGCKGLHGNLILPHNLQYLGAGAFAEMPNMTGDIEIPQGVTDIPETCFWASGFNGNLILHDGIVTIGNDAFGSTPLKGELRLPKNLEVIGLGVFYSCDFSGELVIPETVRTIGDKSFAYNWRLMGVLDIPEGVLSIGAGAFAHCRSIEGVIFPESLESIRYEASYYEDGGAFEGCYGIGSIVSKSTIPPYVQEGAFNGVAKDNFTLEVPESALTYYQTASGWCDFKRISAHRELVCRPATANAINSEAKRTLVLNAEGEWIVESMPEWCSLSQTSGNKKTELTLTIKEMAKGSQPRTGEIVFKLKDKDYTHKCTVSQYDYLYAEDEVITLQKATRGNTGGINLVFLGDGYDGKDISEGKYLAHMQEQVENFFGIEPYKTYRDYFNVYTAIALSTETGIGTVNKIRYVKFNTSFTGGVGLNGDYDNIFKYVLDMKTSVTEANLNQTLIVITPNSTDYGGICHMWGEGAAIAYCPMSTYGYPLDTRGVLQHEAGGHGFGKLADEYIYHNAFIDACSCSCCGHVLEFENAKALGWYDNLSLSGKMHEVPWSHLIFDDRYSDIVDIYEGGYMHSRGVFRSEQNSCMNNEIPYFSTISRESIVKRIKRYAGEEYSFEEFVKNDSREVGTTTKSLGNPIQTTGTRVKQHAPVLHEGSPLK